MIIPKRFSQLAIGDEFLWHSKTMTKVATRRAKIGKDEFIFALSDVIRSKAPIKTPIKVIKKTELHDSKIEETQVNNFLSQSPYNVRVTTIEDSLIVDIESKESNEKFLQEYQVFLDYLISDHHYTFLKSYFKDVVPAEDLSVTVYNKLKEDIKNILNDIFFKTKLSNLSLTLKDIKLQLCVDTSSICWYPIYKSYPNNYIKHSLKLPLSIPLKTTIRPAGVLVKFETDSTQFTG